MPAKKKTTKKKTTKAKKPVAKKKVVKKKKTSVKKTIKKKSVKKVVAVEVKKDDVIPVDQDEITTDISQKEPRVTVYTDEEENKNILSQQDEETATDKPNLEEEALDEENFLDNDEELSEEEVSLDQEEDEENEEDDMPEVVHDDVDLELIGEDDMVALKKRKARKKKEAAAMVSLHKAKKKLKKRTTKLDEELEVDVSSEEKKEIDEELTNIYKNDDGSMPDMTTFKKKRRHGLLRAFVTLFIAVALFGAVALAGLFILDTQQGFSEDNVIVSVSGEEGIVAGQEARYRVRYRNAQDVVLTNVSLDVRYPDGFVFKEASRAPDNDTNNRWEFGTIEPHDSGYIDVYGSVFGDLSQEQSFRVFLNYTPDTFSSEFRSSGTTVVKVDESPIELTVEGVEQVVAGAEATIEVTVKKREGVEEFPENIAVVLGDLPGFSVKESSLESEQDQKNRWIIEDLSEEVSFTIVGLFNPENGDTEMVLPIRLVSWLEGEGPADGFVFAEEMYTVVLSALALDARLAINGTVNELSTYPGDVLNASIVLRNNGDTAFENIRVRAIFEAPSYDNKSILLWNDIEDEADGSIFGEQVSEAMRKGIITWNKSDIRELASLDKGEEVSIDFRLPVKTEEDIDITKFEAFEGTVTLEVQYDSGDDTQESFTNAPLALVFNSDLALEVRDEVVENTDGQDVHTVTWLLSNTFHGVENVIVKADLYGDITFNTDDVAVPAGDIEFAEENKRLTWSVESMPTSVDVLALQFPIILNEDNPSQTNLTSKVELEARDSVTGEQIVLVGDEILLNQELVPDESGE